MHASSPSVELSDETTSVLTPVSGGTLDKATSIL